MKKLQLILTMTLALASTMPAIGQTILEEDFETGLTQPAKTPLTRTEGWTTIDSYKGTNTTYNWYNYYADPTSQAGPTLSGANCAACDGPISSGNTVDGQGPREEILLSPELDLNDTYQLQFSWKVSPMNNRDNSRYDLQVRVVTNNDINSAETVFSIQNEAMLRESGVTVLPIDAWDPHTSKIDLSDWRGEKVKLAFVYKMLAPMSNVAWIDDITVKKFTPVNGPLASISLDRYDFKDMYIGEKMYSEVITLTNIGKNGLKITGMDLPSGVGTTLDPETVDLRAYDKVNFQLTYTATMFAPAKGEAVIHTTGGDVKIAYSANKNAVPEGYTLEGFNQYFPPAGWKSNGWRGSNAAIEGDQSAYAGGDFSATTLRSPRLDLTDGGKVYFTYYNQYDGESVPEYDIELQLSTDGGDNWKTVWASDYQNGLNKLLTAEVDLGDEGTDNSYVRWYYPAIESDDEGAFDHSNFTLDRVLLPHVYGANGVPTSATLIAPASNAKDVYPKNVKLEWGPAQFAKGYKLYVGTNAEVNDLIDGGDLGNVLTYTIPQCDYATTYKWKVVAYNDKGDATTASTWKFTTQPDASVMEFPYTENFDECTNAAPVPTGWLSTTTGSYKFQAWTPNNIYAYGGKGASMATGWKDAGEKSILTSPEFNLPAGGQGMSISFVWGNNHPSDLIIDETGLLKKQNVEGGNGVSDIVFEIFADGEWKQASYLSENNIEGTDGKKYWRNETIDLTEYAGKKVQFRWVNTSFANQTGEAALDNIVINGNVDDMAVFNQDGWDAGKVNFGKAVNSGDQFTMLNKGKKALKVKSVSFGTNNFKSSIAAGTEIAVGEGITFNLQFNAGESAKAIEDLMTVEFESGSKVTFPVSGEGLASDVLYYGFELNPLDYDWKKDFTTIDVDRKVTHQLGYYQTIIEDDGGRIAFTQAQHYNANLKAHNGIGTLAAASPDDQTAANDWLISKQITPAEGATFDFYARNLSTNASVFVGDNDLHSVEVLVSEAGNTKTTDFKAVMNPTEMAYLGENQWHHFNVDLSAYAGKNIYVAVRHTTNSASFLAFFDDFTFNHVGNADLTGIECVKNITSEDAPVAVYNLNGVQVANGNQKGMYIIKTANGKTVKVIRK